MNTPPEKSIVERAPFINIRGVKEFGLLRVTPPVPGRRAGELPGEVPISSSPAPKGKE